MSQTLSDTGPRSGSPLAGETISAHARDLIDEAMRLMDSEDAARTLEIALEELVARQRFLALVSEHEPRSTDP